MRYFITTVMVLAAWYAGIMYERHDWLEREKRPIFIHHWNIKHVDSQVVSQNKLNKKWFYYERNGDTERIKILGPADPEVVKRLSARLALREYYTNGGESSLVIDALYKEIDIE